MAIVEQVKSLAITGGFDGKGQGFFSATAILVDGRDVLDAGEVDHGWGCRVACP